MGPTSSITPSPTQSSIQSPTETGGAVLEESKHPQDLAEDRVHNGPPTLSVPSSASSKAETFPEDEDCQHTVSQPAKELAPLEEPACNMTGESPTPKMTLQEVSELDYRSLQSRNEELEESYAELWKEWKELGEELSDLRANHQPLGQLQDKDLIQSAEQLRYNISNLSLQWPGDRTMRNTPREVQYLPYLQSVTPGYRTLLNDPDRRPQIIEAFIWRVLTGEVFGRFHWAGEIAPSVGDLGNWLASISESDPSRSSDLRMWTSKTTELLLEALVDQEQEPSGYLERLKRGIVGRVLKVLGVPENSKQGIVRQLHDILDGALELDKEFSQQVAEWEWHYAEADCEERLVYDQNLMVLDELPKKKGQRVVKLVVSPALIRRGDTNGKNYDQETIGMKMGVSCKGFQW
ncbi:hypothetical protein CEP54_013211 [Fusarium duplospermum]|uniref:Uncharacterized protein n=1 Tax=Fusarium duplospermum TaxID=1325734 RepID=A0A428P444_9HYPO|nr:hypothetical protein CEP54_013211 [Fusarium duplospermum]